MTVLQYITDPSRVVVPRFVPLAGTALYITHHPLEDPVAGGGPGLAHLTYAGALEVAEGAGARLPSRDEIAALHLAAAEYGCELVPCILPDAVLLAQGSYPGDPRMDTVEWCVRHDGVVLATMADILVKIGDSDSPFANMGKQWIGGAPPNLAALCGWWVAKRENYVGRDEATGRPLRSGAGFIQQGYGYPHDRGHSDYATTCMLVRDSAPES